MTAYLEPIKLAFISFPILAFLISLPFMVYNYRKYGYINKWRSFIVFTFIFYLLVAYYLVIFPLPATRDIKSLQRPGTVHYNLKPFEAFRAIGRETRVKLDQPRTYGLIFKERAFLQVFFNILLLLPFGAYLAYYFKKSLAESLVLGFLLSLFFELTQLSGLYGIYNAAYRLFDIDDLFLNTLGVGLGHGLLPLLEVLLPDPDSLDQGREEELYRVSYGKRFLAFLIDILLVSFLSGAFYKETGSLSFLVFMSYFGLVVYFLGGRSLGLYLLGLRLKADGKRPSLGKLLKRSFLIYCFLYGIDRFLALILEGLMDQEGVVEYGNIFLLIFIARLAYNLLMLFHIIYGSLKKKKFFYESLSGCYTDLDQERLGY